ncbi:uncharacterized protein CXQ87_001087 [Candidozyma duobushaemuli]|uniref:Mitochondrial import inner membrane translocase subunit TIM16 n=1 Tax=Candidozyma duobushaemuli TaxID=1231522 RepID=A0A2V1AJC0_9ASCO|nr:uncharacterized protein CXQ87_001087 [[Candida] duobushaemulonis]PVH18170.1 hypothetical protein CXQ87_001087 [[Candida] duobushaemulonis]
MAHRLLVNVIFTGASVFGRAFTEAYKQAAKASQIHRWNPIDEAMKILDIEKEELSLEEIEKKYEYLFDVNSKEKGNSFFLQSKVYYASDTLRKELEYLQKMREAKEGKQEAS